MPTDSEVPPRLSVIIATWNAADTLPAAIGSVLDQADADLECVVVDDGSTDDTPALLERLAHPRLVVERLARNGGVVRADTVSSGSVSDSVDAIGRHIPSGRR